MKLHILDRILETNQRKLIRIIIIIIFSHWTFPVNCDFYPFFSPIIWQGHDYFFSVLSNGWLILITQYSFKLYWFSELFLNNNNNIFISTFDTHKYMQYNIKLYRYYLLSLFYSYCNLFNNITMIMIITYILNLNLLEYSRNSNKYQTIVQQMDS